MIVWACVMRALVSKPVTNRAYVSRLKVDVRMPRPTTGGTGTEVWTPQPPGRLQTAVNIFVDAREPSDKGRFLAGNALDQAVFAVQAVLYPPD